MSEQTEEPKRGPGRPRKIRTPEPPGQMVPPLRVIGIADIAKKLGRSRTTARRLANLDPDFPISFRLVGYDAWLESDIDDYFRRKAERARQATQAQPEGAASPV